MQKYDNPIPAGVSPDAFTDVDKITFMRNLAEQRRERQIAIPRFVRALNKAGYDIPLAVYKECEMMPGKAIEQINNGMLVYAYRVLNAVRVQNSVQGKHTSAAMRKIAETRVAKNYDYFHMSEELNSVGVKVTEAEYRAAEQGMTKIVSFELIIEAALILNIDPADLYR